MTLLLVLITTIGVRAEVVPIQKQSVGTHVVTTNQQETILQLQEENKKLKEQLERTEMDKEIQRCRDYVDRRANDINDNLSHWLAILTIIVALISGGLGVVAPYFRNKEMQAKLNVATRQADDAKEQAEKAEIALKEIEVLKRQVDAIQTKINEDKEKAEQAAKEAKVSQLFAQAVNEIDSSRAIELYTQLLKLDSNIAAAYNNRGLRLYNLGDLDGALSDYDKAISLNPDYDATVYYNRGSLKYNLGDLDGALSDYDKAISLNPDYAEAYNNRALCYCKMVVEEKDKEKKKEYLALAKVDEKKFKELTGGEKK